MSVCLSACLSVCLFVRIARKPHDRTLPNCFVYVSRGCDHGRSSFDGVANLRCVMYTSDFVNDVTSSYDSPIRLESNSSSVEIYSPTWSGDVVVRAFSLYRPLCEPGSAVGLLCLCARRK